MIVPGLREAVKVLTVVAAAAPLLALGSMFIVAAANVTWVANDPTKVSLDGIIRTLSFRLRKTLKGEIRSV